jgi:hypothetical protein
MKHPNIMTYQNEIKDWLSDYKITHFKKLENGIWKRNKKQYPHILPVDNWLENFLPKYKTELTEYIRTQKIKLHSDFHHLNSSQAMCLNIFYPLIKETKLDLLVNVLKLDSDSVDYDSVRFEKESNIEKEKGYRPTNFDFYFRTINNKKIYFEIKYTELGFGKAKCDKEHFDKYESVYKNHCSVINPKYCNCNDFLDNYQLMRNLIHLSNNSYVVFIFPVNNKKIKQQAEFAKSTLVTSDFQQNIIILTWEHLLGYIDSITLGSEKLDSQMIDFKDKYKIKPIGKICP